MLLSIIIVNHNTEKLLDDCIGSIVRSAGFTDVEIVVVDNASNDGSISMMKEKYSQVKIVENTENVGFGKANNQGVKQSSGDWILLLNSDTLFKPLTLSNIVALVKKFKDNNVVVGCRLLNSDGSIQQSAGFFPTIVRIVAQMLFVDDLPVVNKLSNSYQQSEKTFYTKDRTVDWVTGACMLMPKKIFEEVRGFDGSIFMYGEEVDLCYRLKRKGARVLFTPAAELFHIKGASSRKAFVAAVTGEYKGLMTFYRKHYPKYLIIVKPVLVLGALLRIFLFAMIDWKRVEAYKEAIKVVMQ